MRFRFAQVRRLSARMIMMDIASTIWNNFYKCIEYARNRKIELIVQMRDHETQALSFFKHSSVVICLCRSYNDIFTIDPVHFPAFWHTYILSQEVMRSLSLILLLLLYRQ